MKILEYIIEFDTIIWLFMSFDAFAVVLGFSILFKSTKYMRFN